MARKKPPRIDFMAAINCPHGHRWIARVSRSVTSENREVNIFAGVCDRCDLCGFRDCEYFDDTPEGTRRYQQGLAELHGTIEGQFNDRRYQAELRAKHRRDSSL
jgi:hypothetical protein